MDLRGTLGRLLRRRVRIEPLDVDAIVERYRWPVNGGHFVSDAGLLANDDRRPRMPHSEP